MSTSNVPPSWRVAIADLVSQRTHLQVHDNINGWVHPLTYLIKGAKNAGKSTFARTLLNDLLKRHTRVAFLECDPGQTEFTPPGLLSLHVVDTPVTGPPFTHLLPPFRSHFLGSTTPRNNPSHYLSCIEALAATYAQNFGPPDYDVYESGRDASERVPLVVNTMGWTKGFGGDLLKRIEELVMPTHVISIGEASEPRGEDILQAANTTTYPSTSNGIEPSEPTTISVESIPVDNTGSSSRYTASDWRALSLMSYFHSSLQPSPFTDIESLLQWNASSPLLTIKPYAVSPRLAFDSIVLSGPGSDDVVLSEMGRVLNGAIVAFVSCEPGSIDFLSAPPPSQTECSIPYRQGAPLPDPRTSSCVGLGLIRGVSPDLLSPDARRDGETTSEVLHIITPIPLAVLCDESCRCIVKGEIELPVWGMTDSRDGQGGLVDDIPYLQSRRSGAAGSDRRRVRRNIMRKSQF